jgi:molybdopterin synthase sulfur carrier subunit
MPITIRIPGSLKDWLNGSEEAICEGYSIKDCFNDMERQFPGFRHRVMDDGGYIPNVLIFLNGENIRNLAGLKTRVKKGDQIGIIPLAAGG